MPGHLLLMRSLFLVNPELHVHTGLCCYSENPTFTRKRCRDLFPTRTPVLNVQVSIKRSNPKHTSNRCCVVALVVALVVVDPLRDLPIEHWHRVLAETPIVEISHDNKEREQALTIDSYWYEPTSDSYHSASKEIN